MHSVWPWLAIAAAGALHGLNPAAGWALCVGAHGAKVWRTVAAGQVAAVSAVAIGVPLAWEFGGTFDASVVQGAAGVLVLLLVAHALTNRLPLPRAATGLWTFIVGLAHGAGWLLVPAFVPLCGGSLPGREIVASGSLLLGLAAVVLHLAAMLAVTAAVAMGARRGWRSLLSRWAPSPSAASYLGH